MFSKIRFIVLLATIIVFASCDPPPFPDENPEDLLADRPYQERNRPQYHFTPPQQWMNDPNGMVYFDGEYHLFYQHYPDSNVWGPMHWGHAISTDLVRWEHLPIALYPDSLGYIFSGSAVVDWQNTSGFGTEDEPPLIAIFTHHLMEGEKAGRNDFQYQSIAYSTDRGRSWNMYAGNPVIPNPGIKDFRDPKVIWDEDSQQWVMIFAAFDHVKIYGSPDLKSWTHLSDFGLQQGSHEGVWECPDLFKMNIEEAGVRGQGSVDRRWVMIVSVQAGSPNGGTGAQYFIGDFDGKEFVLDPAFAEYFPGEKTAWIDYGRDNYAGVTWSDIPEEDGRRIFLGWMSNWQYAQKVPTTAWRSAMTLPRTLSLREGANGLRLHAEPVQELQKLRTNHLILRAGATLQDSFPITFVDHTFDPSLSEMQLRFELPESGSKAIFGVELKNDQGEYIRVGYDAGRQMYFTDRTQAGQKDFSDVFATERHYAPRQTEGPSIDLHLFFDKSSVELFADDGQTVMTDIFFPNEDYSAARLFVENGEVDIVQGEVWQLQSIW